MAELDLFGVAGQNARLSADLRAAFGRVLDSGAFVLGAEVAAFEREVAEFCGVAHAIGVSSGTDALVCALTALGCGPGTEVVLPAFSFFATAEAVCRVGATPRFVDIELSAYGMDMEALRASLNGRTRAVVPVHLYGCPRGIGELCEWANEHGVGVVEDAAQAFGARFAERFVGSWGRLGCFSFFPTKSLGGFGDGGMVVTNDPELAERCRQLRAHGAVRKHEHAIVGGNYRLDALQAALLRVKLPHVETWRQARAAHALAYAAELADVPELALARSPALAESAHGLFTVRVLDGRRDELCRYLAARGIQSAVYYPRTLPAQPALAFLGHTSGDFPNAELACRQVLSLPLFAELTLQDRGRVVGAVREFFR